jgi:hypothetical protein
MIPYGMIGSMELQAMKLLDNGNFQGVSRIFLGIEGFSWV